MRSQLGVLLLLSLGAPASARAEAPANESCDVYYFGIGQRRDLGRAFACEMAEPEERRNWVLVSVMYLNGEGTSRDVRRARAALEHNRPEECGVTCAVLDEVLRRHEAAPNKSYRRIDYCKDIAQTTLDVNYCLGVETRRDAFRRKREAKALVVGLPPESSKRFTALAQAFAKFKEADGLREYQNFKEGTIRGEASAIMEKRVSKHHAAALAAWGPKATQVSAGARPLADADRELNEVYRGIMAGLSDALAEAQTTPDPEERKSRVQAATEVKTATRDAERAWMRYAEAWKGFVKAARPDDAEALESLRAFLTEQRIRELKYPSIGESGATDPEEE
jgi:uncharacterized protein YecT (DUF1311 family)